MELSFRPTHHLSPLRGWTMNLLLLCTVILGVCVTVLVLALIRQKPVHSGTAFDSPPPVRASLMPIVLIVPIAVLALIFLLLIATSGDRVGEVPGNGNPGEVDRNPRPLADLGANALPRAEAQASLDNLRRTIEAERDPRVRANLQALEKSLLHQWAQIDGKPPPAPPAAEKPHPPRSEAAVPRTAERKSKSPDLDEKKRALQAKRAQERMALLRQSQRIEQELTARAQKGPLDPGLGSAAVAVENDLEQPTTTNQRIEQLREQAQELAIAGDMPGARAALETAHKFVNGLHDRQVQFRQRAGKAGVKFLTPLAAVPVGNQLFQDRIELERDYQRKLQTPELP